MVPNGVPRQPLGFCFAEFCFVPLVLGGDPSDGCCGNLFWMKDDPPNEVIVFPSLSRDVPLSGHKNGLFCVVGSQYHWELCVVDPSSFPIYFWLCGSKPWVAEDCLLLSKFCEVETKVGVIGSCLAL